MKCFYKFRTDKSDVIEAKAVEVSSEYENSLRTAAAAKNIVDEGIENNDLSGMSERLGSLPVPADEHEQFVFEAETAGTQYLAIGLGGFFCLVFGLLVFLGLNTFILTDLFETLASGMVVFSALVLAVNLSVIAAAVHKLRYNERYTHYYDQLRYHRIEAVDDISEMTGYPKSLVVKDLRKAVQRKYIPEGHFGRNCFLFMVSDQIYDGYQKKPAVYDHYFKEKIEERERMRGHNSDTQLILETGKSYIEKIHDSNDLIQDKAVSDKLDRMEKTVTMIFKEVDLHPEQSEKLGMFLNYYLPTTEKLLQNYISIDEKGVNSRTLSKMLRELSGSLDTINLAFERILETLYMEQESDLLSDIETMEAMLSSEGLLTPNE